MGALCSCAATGSSSHKAALEVGLWIRGHGINMLIDAKRSPTFHSWAGIFYCAKTLTFQLHKTSIFFLAQRGLDWSRLGLGAELQDVPVPGGKCSPGHVDPRGTHGSMQSHLRLGSTQPVGGTGSHTPSGKPTWEE